MKRRDFWIDNVDFDLNWRKVSVAEFPHKLTIPGSIHVREVLPDSIEITREEARRMLFMELSRSEIEKWLDEKFDPLPEGTHDGN